jgi:DeoR family glycerol-3-phosphate regulon repressor
VVAVQALAAFALGDSDGRQEVCSSGAGLRQFRVDIAVIGISGIEPDGSLRDFDYREVKVAQTIIEHAREVWLAADSSKFNRPAMVELATLSQINRLFTDTAPPEPFPALLEEAGVSCEVAHP